MPPCRVLLALVGDGAVLVFWSWCVALVGFASSVAKGRVVVSGRYGRRALVLAGRARWVGGEAMAMARLVSPSDENVSG